MARDASNKRQNEKLARIQKQYDREDDEALRAVLGTENGRLVLMRIARRCRWMGDPWDANSVRLTDYESGRRAAGLDLMTWIESVDGGLFMAMQREAQTRDTQAAQTRAAAITEPAANQQEEDDNG